MERAPRARAGHGGGDRSGAGDRGGLYAVPAGLTWDVGGDAVPFVLGSTAFELGYVVTLAAGLSRGDLSVV